MKPLTLKAVPENDTQCKSILCNDNKGCTLATVWADQQVSINHKDLYVDELRQLQVIAENFFLFFNNIHKESKGKEEWEEGTLPPVFEGIINSHFPSTIKK